jgi:hypothetical protein
VATRFRRYRSFRNARAFVRRLHLKNAMEWRGAKLPRDIPRGPHLTYKNRGWVGWGNWLGTGTLASRREYRQFGEARAFVRAMGLQSQDEWRKYCKGKLPMKGKLPPDVPRNPNITYKNKGWVSTGDWLGTGTVATRSRRYRPFEEARAFVHRLRLRSTREWRQYCKGELREKGKPPQDIPACPDRTYKKDWLGMGDWLGTGLIATQRLKYRSFWEARAFVHRLRLRSTREWRQYCKGELSDKGKLPHDIPANPDGTFYKDHWLGMSDWLGTGNIATKYRPVKPVSTGPGQPRDQRLSLKVPTIGTKAAVKKS